MANKDLGLLSIYGARKSKDGKRCNISVVQGKGEDRVFGTISLPLDKIKVAKDKKSVYICVKVLEKSKKTEAKAKEATEKVTDELDDLPF